MQRTEYEWVSLGRLTVRGGQALLCQLHVREFAVITDSELSRKILLVHWLEVAIPFGNGTLRGFSDWPMAEALWADDSQCIPWHDWRWRAREHAQS